MFCLSLWQYGNAEKIYTANGTNHIHWGHEGSMEAVSFINSTTYGTNMSTWNVSEDGTVPGQIMADLEDGLWFGNKKLPPHPDMNAEFVTALVKGKGGDLFTLKGANAQTGPLQLIYNGSRPSVTCKDGRKKVVPCDPAVHGYNPMKLQGAIIMGTPRRPRTPARRTVHFLSSLWCEPGDRAYGIHPCIAWVGGCEIQTTSVHTRAQVLAGTTATAVRAAFLKAS